MRKTRKISIVTPCFNEEENVRNLSLAVNEVMAELPGYTYEHIFIDNASKDRTVEILKEIAKSDTRTKIIVNARNFGHIRSPYHGLLQSTGDATILLVADFQDPPELIPQFIGEWEKGVQVVVGVKTAADESPLMFLIRTSYYNLVSRLSDIELNKNTTGFGIYDRSVLEVLRGLGDPYPYFRGLISDLGFTKTKIEYRQPVRKRGITKNNFYTLYDMAMLGIISHSKVPLRVVSWLGFGMSILGFVVALAYLVAKLIFWSNFTLGIAPVLIGFFLFSSVQLFFIGMIGEYIGAIHTQVMRRPLVIEKERVNF